MKYRLKPESGRDYAAELNPEQYAAVTTEARHALVIAGAGSGKTRTLTYRVARLMDEGVAPWRILLLTFTNKAAREMLERVGQLAGVGAGQVWGGTFHSVANRLLRRYAARLGYRDGFSILDSDDQKALFRALVKEYAGKMGKTDRFPKPEVLLSLHSLAANTSRTWQAVLREEYPHLDRHMDTIGKIYDAYAQRKLDGNSMDFDDLLLNLVRLLQEHEDVRGDLQQRFLHVLVDEYQDTNTVQERIISLLSAGEDTSLMAVGDDAQSIYSWRGANVEHIFSFTETYPGAVVYKIETNYRSVPSILAVSNAAISMNKRQVPKELRAARDPGPRAFLPVVLPAPDNRTEARFVAQRIDELMSDGTFKGKDIAVLYRSHFQSLDVQMALTKNHIPFRVTSGLRFFEQAHIKDVVAYLRLLANPRDGVAFTRIVSTFPRVGAATAGKLWEVWKQKVVAWFDAHPESKRLSVSYAKVLDKTAVPAAARLPWVEFMANMDELNPAGVELTPPELVTKATGFMETYMRSAYDNYDDRIDDLDQLARTLAEQPDLDAFLTQVALMSEVDNDSAMDDDCVTMSTVHQAKGLEWKVVFVVFLAEGQFPHSRALCNGTPDEVEEETRLFYVAVTRAQDQLYLSYPRYNGNSYDCQFCSPSRFLRDLPRDLYDQWEV